MRNREIESAILGHELFMVLNEKYKKKNNSVKYDTHVSCQSPSEAKSMTETAR